MLLQHAVNRMPLETPIGEISTPPLTIGPEETTRSAIEKLRRNHSRYLLVTNGQGSLKGLISETDLLEASHRLLVRAEKRYRRIERLAYRDALTGLFTRRYFERALHSEVRRTQRYGGLLALLLLDLDHFKEVNDRYGHPAGDQVLRMIGKLVQKHIRKVDIPARYGEDEFAILMPEGGTRTAAILGERIREEVARAAFAHNGQAFSFTYSGGACKWIEGCSCPADLLHEADRFLYQAKCRGRNRIVVPP